MAKNKIKFISYTGLDEVIITTPKKKDETLLTYFSPTSGRDIDDYDREDHYDCGVIVIASLRTRN